MSKILYWDTSRSLQFSPFSVNWLAIMVVCAQGVHAECDLGGRFSLAPSVGIAIAIILRI